MSIYLLANVGTRDVQLSSLDELPPELIANPKTGQLKARLAGDYLLQKEQFLRFLPYIRLPMIDKALRQLQVDQWADLRLVLFATDQDESVAAFYRDGDTINFAHLIREVLFERYHRNGLTKKQIEVKRSKSNPADYDLMYDFYREELPVIARRITEPAPAYLLIAGGTPQMNTMLLLIGTETFGPDARPLYVAQESDRAHDLDITRTLYQRAFLRNTDTLLRAYAYGFALELLRNNAAYLESDQVLLLESALEYAIARRNLNLEGALRAFDATLARSRSLRGTIRSFQQEMTDQSETALLRETIFLAQIAAETSNWADLLARLHRFSEGCMQLLAERLGVQWSDATTRSSYKQEWWNTNRALLATLNLAKPEPPAPALETQERRVDRKNLRQIVAALATGVEHETIRKALSELELVDKPIPLRNDIVHRFSPISQEEIEKKAHASIETLLKAMRQTFVYAFDLVIADETPYVALNRLCADMLKGQK